MFEQERGNLLQLFGVFLQNRFTFLIGRVNERFDLVIDVSSDLFGIDVYKRQGMDGAVQRAEQLQAEHPGSFIPDQFGNPANAMAHEKTTGPEILRDLDGEVDFFVAAVGTGGTLTGTGRALKRACPACQVVAVEPAASPLLSQGVAGSHRIQGIGANFVPKVLDRSVIDEIIPVEDDAAFEMSRQLARTEGLLVGISAGAAVWAARALAMRPENRGKKIVVLLPDTGERYLSSGLYEV